MLIELKGLGSLSFEIKEDILDDLEIFKISVIDVCGDSSEEVDDEIDL